MKNNSVTKININTENQISLSDLMVFDTLTIGPVTIEPTRIKARYSIEHEDLLDSKDLIYSYEEAVFDPNDRIDRNLASMILAQVALNYGLFFRRIVFLGNYDDTDVKFLSEMAENTSREIYVKKFIEFNPYLTKEIQNITPLKLKKYLQASLEFPDVSQNSLHMKWQHLPINNDRYAILSSGGKDSLLSYGVLNESGFEVHPVFINESGRHWFTALNAYRYFRDQISNTCRVWTNADRIYNWVLRHLPFIRNDYTSIRADEYPVRLWTVAVFLFGALPILKKRKIGNLIIGDEYDTTVRSNLNGIPHYDGLYDQSRYFDNNMTRYYLRKGWFISQFSILRPLSEFLIEKILVERYPNLQQNQISCHAAHKNENNGRIHPCGKCEKCRRIVCMLLSMDADPTRCGYSQSQIDECLSLITTMGLHQEAAGVEHIKYLLHRKGLIKVKNLSGVTEHPEIERLRFDQERSPINATPLDLRHPIFSIYLHHAKGAVIRSGRTWREVDILHSPDIRQAYAFDFRTMKNRRPNMFTKSKRCVNGSKFA